MPAGLGGLDLAVRRDLDGAAQDLGGVGGGVEREGEQRAEPGLLEQRPETALLHGLELAEPVIDQEQLDQQRRAAEEIGVGPDRPVEQRVARGARDRQRHRQAAAPAPGPPRPARSWSTAPGSRGRRLAAMMLRSMGRPPVGLLGAALGPAQQHGRDGGQQQVDQGRGEIEGEGLAGGAGRLARPCAAGRRGR